MRRRKHKKQPSVWGSWQGLYQRCYNPNNPHYKDYGARGIRVCDRWLDRTKVIVGTRKSPQGFNMLVYRSQGYLNFLVDMGERPKGKTLDRKDNDGNYEPSNCRWATRSQQNLNRRPFKRKTAITCKVEGCEGLYCAKGYCQKHYTRIWKNGTLTPKYQLKGAI